MNIKKTTAPKRLSKRMQQLTREADALGFRPLGWAAANGNGIVLAAFSNDRDGTCLVFAGSDAPFDPIAIDCVSTLDRGGWLTTTTFPLVVPQPRRGIFKFSYPDADLPGLLNKHQRHLAKLKAKPVRPPHTLGAFLDDLREFLRVENGEAAAETTPAEDTLSPAADKFLSEALAEFNAKQDALGKDWRFASYASWGFDQLSGMLRLEFRDGSELQADGQILGSYAKEEGSWEWAWNNPHVLPAMARDSKRVKRLGQKLKISYLLTGKVPTPDEKFATYLAAIGVKATDAVGLFRAPAGDIEVMIAVKQPHWTKTKQKKPKSTGRARKSTKAEAASQRSRR